MKKNTRYFVPSNPSLSRYSVLYYKTHKDSNHYITVFYRDGEERTFPNSYLNWIDETSTKNLNVRSVREVTIEELALII